MMIGKKEVPDELYVVLVENDAGIHTPYADQGEAICWEHPLAHATLDAAVMVKRRLGNKYGATKIAKLIVTEIGEKP